MWTSAAEENLDIVRLRECLVSCRWLAVDEDDGQIRRRLKPFAGGSTATTYK